MNDGTSIPSRQLLAGVFMDMLTGQIEVGAGPGIDPIIMFADAILNIERQRMQAAQSQIVVPSGPLPDLKG